VRIGGNAARKKRGKSTLIRLALRLQVNTVKFCHPAPHKKQQQKFTGNKYHRDSEKAKAFYRIIP